MKKRLFSISWDSSDDEMNEYNNHNRFEEDQSTVASRTRSHTPPNEHSERKQVRQCSFSIIDRCSFFLSRRVHQMVSDPILISIIHQSKIQSFDIEMKEYF